jgi:hypothetical protein
MTENLTKTAPANHSPKKKLAAIILLSLTVSLMLFTFAPLDLYFRFPPNFILGLGGLLPWFLLFSFAGFVALSVALILLWKTKLVIGLALLALPALIITFARFSLGFFSNAYIYLLILIAIAIIAWTLAIKLLKEKAVDCALLLLFGCMLAAYIQSLFLNGNMVMIGESTAPHNALSFLNISNLLTWLIIAAAPLILWLVFRKNKDLEIDTTLVIITAVILCLQIGTTTVGAINTPRHEGLGDSSMHLVYEPVLDLSSEENIIVFLIDSFNTSTLIDLLEEYPELNYQLDGFTLYKNNIPNYIKTFPAITTMLTQHYYEENTDFLDFFEEAWSREGFLDTLRASGFRINLILDEPATYGNIENLVGNADNLVDDMTYINIFPVNIFLSSSRLSGGVFAPYLLKEPFLRGFPADFGNTFAEVISYDYTVVPPQIGDVSDLLFYDLINQNALSVNDDSSVFNFIYLIGGHITSRLGYYAAEDRIYRRDDNNHHAATRASLHIMNTFINQLREAGVFDNTTIIILSDHVDEHGPRNATTALLIKPKGASGRLQFNYDAELSNKYFGASVLQIAGLPHEHLGLSYFDIIGGAPPPPRFLYRHDPWHIAFHDSSNAISLLYVYEVSGDANNPENWRLVDDRVRDR